MIFIYDRWTTYVPWSTGLGRSGPLAVGGRWPFRTVGLHLWKQIPGHDGLDVALGVHHEALVGRRRAQLRGKEGIHGNGGRARKNVVNDHQDGPTPPPRGGRDRFWKNDHTNEKWSWGYITAPRLVWMKHLKTPLTSFRSIIPSQHKVFVMTPLWVRCEKHMGTISNTLGANRFLRGHKIWTRCRQTNFRQACDLHSTTGMGVR